VKSSNGMCDCKRSSGNEFFWNGVDCIPAGDKMFTCKKDYECLSSLVCLDKISRCAAKSFYSSFLRSNEANHFLIKQLDLLKLSLFTLILRELFS
jgi:hypothetical protein